MRYLMITLVCLLLAISLRAQDNCFEKCMENFKKSTLPFPESNNIVVQGLIGCKAPDFNVKTIEGKNLKLSDLKGKVVVINFWFTSCAPCKAELPALNRLKNEYQGKDVVFIAFARDNDSSLIDFLKVNTFNYQIVSSDFDLAEDYCILGGWPTNMVLDTNGIVRQIFTGGSIDDRAKTEAYDKLKPTIEEHLIR